MSANCLRCGVKWGTRRSRAPRECLANRALRRGTPAFEFKSEALPLPDELVLDKRVNSAFIGTDLKERLRSAGADHVVVVGLTTDHCCSTTARMAGNLDVETWFVADATATHARAGFDAETMHQTVLASLDGEFARVMTTAEAIERLHQLVLSP